jgi:hypothetical protein
MGEITVPVESVSAQSRSMVEADTVVMVVVVELVGCVRSVGQLPHATGHTSLHDCEQEDEGGRQC